MKFGTDKIFYLIIFSYVAYIVVLIINRQPNPFYGFGGPEIIEYQNDLKPIDKSIPDTIPYKEYLKRKDSINTIRNTKNGDGYIEGSSANFTDWIGTLCSMSCDTCSLNWINKLSNTAGTHRQYYIVLDGWTLNLKKKVFTQTDTSHIQVWYGLDSVEFYVKDNQAYIRKVMKKTFGSKNDPDYYLTDIPVKFRFHDKDKSLMIPVSKAVKNTMDVIILVLGICLAVYLLWLVLEFFAFILDLSRGKVFTDKNIKSLRLIGVSLLIIPIILFLLNLLTRLIFNSYFTPDVVLSNVYISLWKIIVVGFVFYVLYRAFKAGKALKDEHNLTV